MVVKLKHALPCIRLRSDGDISFNSSGHAYTGIRWKLT